MLKGLTLQNQTDFQLNSSFWLSLAGGSIMLPSGIFHLFHQNWLPGAGAIIIALSLFLGTWTCYKKVYNSIYTFLLLTPFSTCYVAYLTYSEGIGGSYWSYPTVLIFYFMMSERQAWVSTIGFVATMLPLAWHLFDTPEAARLSITLILVSVYAAVFLRVIARLYTERCQQAITDPLTGLYNRELLQDSLKQAIQQTDKTHVPFTLISVDVDYFKKINDELGHDVGDRVLVELGAFLKGFFRETDKVFRTGGEEFLVLVRGACKMKSIDLAERLRTEIENLSLIPGRKVTVSIGVSRSDKGKDWQQWMKVCDNNLYEAKSRGRNQVVSCSLS